MRLPVLAAAVLSAALAATGLPARAEDPYPMLNGSVSRAAGPGGKAILALQLQLNKQLIDESRRSQCAFKVDSAELAPGCGPKAKRLANAMISAKKKLVAAGYPGLKFIVSGHTDSSGDPQKNNVLSALRAHAMKKELEKAGVPAADIQAVGMGSQQPVVKPDDTPEKKAKNRRYEVQITL